MHHHNHWRLALLIAAVITIVSVTLGVILTPAP